MKFNYIIVVENVDGDVTMGGTEDTSAEEEAESKMEIVEVANHYYYYSY